ncbi:MAG: hypothetical protein HY370_03525 [Proteobacteria bacterium]|nr:hypothetical protein [Pseudomonadota bacterium]
MKILACATVLFLAFLLSDFAYGQGFDLTKTKKIVRYDTLSDEDFMKRTVLHEEHPYEDRYLAYQIRLPIGWGGIGVETKKQKESFISQPPRNPGREKKSRASDTVEQTELSRRILGKITSYFGPPRLEPRSKLEIQALELSYDITAHNWFLYYIISNGYTLEGMEDVTKTRVEALYILVEKDVSYVVRTIAEINGPRIVLVSYYVPEVKFHEEKAMQEKVLASFRFASPEQVRIEQTKNYAFLDLLQFDYPSTWHLQAPSIYSIDQMDARLINVHDKETLNGEIMVHVISTELDTTLAEEVGYLKEELEKSGLSVGELVETVDRFKLHSHVYFSRAEVYKANDRSGRIREHEYWLVIMAEDRYYYIITLLTPGRNQDLYMWIRNTEALQTLVESIRP